MLDTISKDGSLFEKNPTNGARTKVGNNGVLNTTDALTTLNGKLYTIQIGRRVVGNQNLCFPQEIPYILSKQMATYLALIRKTEITSKY